MKTLPIAAAALILVAGSANAMMTLNGRYLNGYSLNTLTGNGWTANGVTANGSRLNAVGKDAARESSIGSIELIGVELPR